MNLNHKILSSFCCVIVVMTGIGKKFKVGCKENGGRVANTELQFFSFYLINK